MELPRVTASGEIWRIVRSVPEVLASSEGRVMRMPYAKQTPTGYHTFGGQPGFGTWDRREGRFVFTVAGKTYRVARLVAEAFHGPPPFPGAITLHIDERASNNRASNLKWGTYAENLNAPGFLEYCRSRTGAANPRVKAKRKRDAEWIAKLKQCDMFDSTMEDAQ
jgi:hypothetical protein